ncbi:MAG: nucleoside phosphorylase [Bacteroidota bacterium]
MALAASELILNADGSVYHLHLRPEQIANTIITVGDPDRVLAVSKHFDRIDTKVQQREFVTHTGELGGKRLSVISTGIGTDNIDIVINELDALVNIDLSTREIKERHTALELIRIGTSGSMQADVSVDSFLATTTALGMDGLLHFYEPSHTDAALDELQTAFTSFCQSRGIALPITPYFASADSELLSRIGKGWIQGITMTCAGFYAPQCRELRAKSRFKTFLDEVTNFDFQQRRLTNFEMETAGIYGLANRLGHRALSCNAILANRQTGTFSQQARETVNQLIETVLERI